MERSTAPRTLRRFFDGVVRRSFGDLTIRDEVAADYLADLLTRFAHAENLYPISAVTGERIERVVDLLMETQRVWELDSPHWNPGEERELKRQIGDYTLFMTGLFRERVEGLACTGYYIREGKRAYRFVSEHDRAGARPHAGLFRSLSDRFEGFAGALSYMRKVYFFRQLITQW